MRFPKVSMRFPRIDLELTSELTQELTRIDLPHASSYSRPQIPVSVIISCKTAKSGLVENTALSQMRSDLQRQLAAEVVGVSGDHFAWVPVVYIWRHFVVLTINLDHGSK